MTDFMTANHFVQKVEWEGGVLEALDYGLKHTHLDPDDQQAAPLRAAWKDLEEKFVGVRPIIKTIDGLIEDISEDGDSE